MRPRTGATIICPICGTERYFRPSHSARIFCGKKCQDLSYRTGKTFQCEICGDDFYRNLAQLEYRGPGRFCSKRCKGISMKAVVEKQLGKPKKQKVSIAKLKKKLWKVFADYIKQRDNYICFTCGARCEGYTAHAGHFIPKSVGGLALYFHEDNVHCQCMRCNIYLGGCQYEYGRKLGEELVEELMQLRGKLTKWTEYDYQKKIEYYQVKRDELSTEKVCIDI